MTVRYRAIWADDRPDLVDHAWTTFGTWVAGRVPGLEVPFCQTICIVLVDRVVDGPPTADDRRGYQSLRRMHVLQGLQLMDVVLVDGERVQSLAIACDPDPIWFEPFTPDAAA